MPHRRDEQTPEIIEFLNSPMHLTMTIDEYMEFRNDWTNLTHGVADKLQKGWERDRGKQA